MSERSCQFSLPATPAVVARSRRQIRGWLSGLEWPEQALADLEYAVSEAVSNAVEHAYRSDPGNGVVEVTAVVEELPDGTRQARVWVRDHGRWRPVPADPGDRGRGIVLMDAFTDELVITRADRPGIDGTEVALLSAPVPGR